MKQFLEVGGGLILTGGILGIGVLARIVLLGYYGLLGHACKGLDGTKNKTVRDMREKLKTRMEMGNGIKSAAVYTEHCMMERKFAGVRIGVWESIGIQSVLLAMLTGAVCALGGVLWECEGKRILEMLFAAGGSAVVLMTMDLVFGLKEKHRRTRICIREHMENVWLMGLGFAEAETETACVHSGKKKEKKEARRKRVKKSKNSEKAAKQKQEKKKRCKAEEEKRRLTEELLRERRQLEARQIAERKKSETEELVIEKSVEEAAATQTTEVSVQALVSTDTSKKEETSYESLLQNVLAEYLV